MANYVGYHFQLRVILIGDSTVGKTCLVRQLIEDTGDIEHSVTLGVDYYSKEFHRNNQVIKLQIWDTAGQERFRSIVKTYYRNAVGGLLVFDVTNKSSFENTEAWLTEARQARGSDENIYILVGNKVDQTKNRVVSQEEAEQFANRNKMSYIETSASNGNNVKEAFDMLVEQIMTLIEENRIHRMRSKSWDGVREGQVLTASMLTSTNTATSMVIDSRHASGQYSVGSGVSNTQTRQRCQC